MARRVALYCAAILGASTALLIACNGGGENSAFTYTPAPHYTDDRGQEVSCDGERPYLTDEVLVATTGGSTDAVEGRATALGFTIRSRRPAPTNVQWLTLGVPAGAVPAAIAALAGYDGVLEATPNYVLYQGDMLVTGGRCASGQPTGS